MSFLFHLPSEHKEMLVHCKELLEYNNGYVSINPRFNKLVISLRTAVENGEGILDKELTSHSDLFDAFRLSLIFWQSKGHLLIRTYNLDL